SAARHASAATTTLRPTISAKREGVKVRCTLAHRTMSSDGSRRAEAKQRWVLTGEAFELLLAALHPERERAAAAYEQLRERTIGLLRWWGASRPEELTDETLDRVARKLAEGAPVPD